MKTNPHASALDTAEDALHSAFLQTGVVSSSPSEQEGGAHHVYVQETAEPIDGPVPVLPPAHGDFYIPPEGAPVVLGTRDGSDYMVLGAAVPPMETAKVDPGERILSHPMSQAAIRFRNNGTLDIFGDSEVHINGGTEGVITDVSPGGTNEYGGITSLDITRSNNVFL